MTLRWRNRTAAGREKMDRVTMGLRARVYVLLALLASVAAGCAKPQAAAVEPTPPPPLTAPMPPPRIILPPQPDAPQPLQTEVVEEATSPRTETRAPRTPQPKPEVAPVEQLAEAPAPPEDAAASAPSLELKQRSGPGHQAVRQQLDEAAGDLENVDYARLSRDLQAQYDTAKRFIVLGGQALKEQNVLFAATLADKASAIARLLLER